MTKPTLISSQNVALMSEQDAAQYLGISKTNLRSLNIQRKMLRSRRLYLVHDLNEFVDSLPYENEDADHADIGWEDVA